VTVGTDRLVSVIIPTCDRPALVSRAVRSALNQTHEALEIIVVDDCSTTPLALPPELARDPRVHLLRLSARAGAGEARNAGVRASHSDLIAFLDDDDEWRPTKVARQLEVLAFHGDSVDAVETGFDLWDGPRVVLRYLPQPDRDLRTALLAQPYLQPSTVLLRRSAFEQLNGFNPRLLRVEDWDFWVRFSDSHEAVALAEVLVDRYTSQTDPAALLRWYREMVRRLEPRIETLPASERSRTRAVHLLAESDLLAALGDAKAARARAFQALREQPRSWRRPVLSISRSLIGERAWSAGKLGLRATVHPVVRVLGRDPLVRR
jgi:glycosyltransferase involved in cell wall biosynthesis